MSETDPHAYEIVVGRVDGRFVATIPALAIFATADTAEAALAGVERKRIAVVDEFRENGFLDRLPKAPPAGGRDPALGRFAAKVGIVAGAVAAVAIVAVVAINLVFSYHVNRLAGIAAYAASGFSPEQMSGRLVSQIETAAARARNLNPAARDKIAADLRTIVRELKPLADELRPLLGCENIESARPAAQRPSQ